MLNIIRYSFLILGIVFLIVSLVVNISFQKKKEKCTQGVEATIVDMNKMERTETGNDAPYISYFPVYEYEYEGKIYRKGSNVGNNKNSFEIGKKVQIYIDPENPEVIYEDSSIPKLIVRIFGGIGIVFILIVVCLKFFLLR